MLSRISTGEHIFAYNVMSSYALERSSRDAAVGVIFPEDYMLVMSRIAFISKQARHPAAAKLFLDFLLSRKGQSCLANHFLTPVRRDVPARGVGPAATAQQAIHVGPALLANLDKVRHTRLISDWKRSLEAR